MTRARSSSDSKENTQDFKIHASNIEQFVETYRLFIAKNEQLSQSGIQAQLNKKFPDGAVKLRTISEWLRQIKKKKDTFSKKDLEEYKKEYKKVDWYKLDQCDLPWEASRSVANFHNKYQYMPTLRVIKWW